MTPAPSRPKRDRRVPARYQPYVHSRDNDQMDTDSSEEDRRKIRNYYSCPNLPGNNPARGRGREDEGAAGGTAAL